jgi:hypothetical protein
MGNFMHEKCPLSLKWREREKYRELKTLGVLAPWRWLLDLNSLAKKGILSYNLP